VWKKLRMTEEDLVIRRRQRAPLRMAHVLEGADDTAITAYRSSVERDQGQITTDYYLNRKGSVTAVQGDANLDQIGDVVHLLDTFFAGSPMPKGLMGYTEDMARDILEDLKRDYYEEVDGLQDTLSWAYTQGFHLHLLLKGINPEAEEFSVSFAERRTETPNQLTDRMLKWQAMGMPQDMIDEEMGFNPPDVQLRRDKQAKRNNPYPEPGAIAPAGRPAPGVKVTPGNAPKGESATSTTHSNRLSEHWPEHPPADPARDAVKALSDIGLALAQRPDPAQPAPQAMNIHLHEAPAAATVSPAPTSQPIHLTAEFKMAEGFIQVPELRMPTIDVHVPTAAAPNVTVNSPAVNVDVAAPSVTLEATLPTPEITVRMPTRRTETTVNRDRQTGEMTGSTSIETDIKE
jgi:hypothetical protein